jgi:hypothetical protein
MPTTAPIPIAERLKGFPHNYHYELGSADLKEKFHIEVVAPLLAEEPTRGLSARHELDAAIRTARAHVIFASLDGIRIAFEQMIDAKKIIDAADEATLRREMATAEKNEKKAEAKFDESQSAFEAAKTEKQLAAQALQVFEDAKNLLAPADPLLAQTWRLYDADK